MPFRHGYSSIRKDNFQKLTNGYTLSQSYQITAIGVYPGAVKCGFEHADEEGMYLLTVAVNGDLASKKWIKN